MEWIESHEFLSFLKMAECRQIRLLKPGKKSKGGKWFESGKPETVSKEQTPVISKTICFENLKTINAI